MLSPTPHKDASASYQWQNSRLLHLLVLSLVVVSIALLQLRVGCSSIDNSSSSSSNIARKFRQHSAYYKDEGTTAAESKPAAAAANSSRVEHPACSFFRAGHNQGQETVW
jgi:hypothetical protein